MNIFTSTVLAGAAATLAIMPLASPAFAAETDRGRLAVGSVIDIADYSIGTNHEALVSLRAGDPTWRGEVELDGSGELKYYTMLDGAVRSHSLFCGDLDDDTAMVTVTFGADNFYRVSC